LRTQVEYIASRFLEFTTEHVFARYIGGHLPPTDAEAAEAAALVRRLRPLAQQTVDAELARAMRTFANRHLREHLDGTVAVQTPSGETPVALPASTIQSVRRVVGAENAAAFIAAAAEREVQARKLDDLASTHANGKDIDQVP
jgi:hypothetical protein